MKLFSSNNRSIMKLMVVILLISVVSVQAQTLQLKLGQHSGQEVVIVAMHGMTKDILGVVALDENGEGILNFGTKQTHSCIAALTITGKKHLYYEFILSPKENFQLVCDGEFVHSGNTTILHSPENQNLDRWSATWQLNTQKQGPLTQLAQLYDGEHFLKKLKKQQTSVANTLSLLNDSLSGSSSFAARYMAYRIAGEIELTKVWQSDSERERARDYFLNTINFEELYHTGQWFSIINACIEVWKEDGKYHRRFGEDVVRVLKNIGDLKVYEELARSAVTITERYGWEYDQQVLVGFLNTTDRLANPSGILALALKAHMLQVGGQAPVLRFSQPENHNNLYGNKGVDIAPDTLSNKYSLLVFYQSDCGFCERAIRKLTKRYGDLVAKGVRILSFSAEDDPGFFDLSAADLPWQDKYCDYQGAEGINFKNYGIIGTPTMFLLNQEGKVLLRTPKVDELLGYLGLNGLPRAGETPSSVNGR